MPPVLSRGIKERDREINMLPVSIYRWLTRVVKQNCMPVISIHSLFGGHRHEKA